MSNNTDTEQTINLYAVDGVVTNTGAYTCKQAAEAKTDSGAWIHLAKSQVTLAPSANEEVPFDITVPGNADVGEHNGCLVFARADDVGEARGNVRIKTRQAIRVVTIIPGELRRDVDFLSYATTGSRDQLQFMLSIKNSGNVSADVDTSVVVKDVFGNEVYKNGGQYPVLADQKLDLAFTNTDAPFWGGWYSNYAEIRYDKTAGDYGVNVNDNELIIKRANNGIIFIMPHAGALLLYVLGLIVLGALVWFWMRRRRLTKEEQATWREYRAKRGDTITDLAEKHNVAWKRLARANKLKAPYTIATGATLRVPKAPGKSVRKTEKVTGEGNKPRANKARKKKTPTA